MKEKGKVIRWIREHRKELAIAGVSIAAVIGAVLLYRNRAALKEYWNWLMRFISKNSRNAAKAAEGTAKTAGGAAKATETVVKAAESAGKVGEVIPFKVSGHVRTLPKGRYASPAKIAEAAARNIPLEPGQTLVDGYWKGVAA